MKNKIKIFIATMFVLVFSLIANAVPDLPMQIYGTVTIDGKLAPDGTNVSVKMNDQTIIQKAVTKNGKFGYDPLFIILPDDITTPAKEGPIENEIIQIYVNTMFVLNTTFQKTYEEFELNIETEDSLDRIPMDFPSCTEEWICNPDNLNYIVHQLINCSLTESERCENGCVNGTCRTTAAGTSPPASNASQTTVCTPLWDCASWGACTNGVQTRKCTDKNNCNKIIGKPIERQTCKLASTTQPATPYTPPKTVEEPELPEIESVPTTPPEEEQPTIVETPPTIIDTIKKFVWVIASAIGAILIMGIVLAFVVFKKKPAKIAAKIGVQSTQLGVQKIQEPPEHAQLNAYIQRMRQSRYNDTQIRQALINTGWQPRIIDSQLNTTNSKFQSAQPMTQTSQQITQTYFNRLVQQPEAEPAVLQLLNYIKKERMKGISDEQIQLALINTGWDSTLVQQEMQKK